MVAESEWGGIYKIIEDFQKLLIVRSITLRVIVFDAAVHEQGMEGVVKELAAQVERYEQSEAGDTYLLTGYNYDDKCWWFEYAIIRVGKDGIPEVKYTEP